MNTYIDDETGQTVKANGYTPAAKLLYKDYKILTIDKPRTKIGYNNYKMHYVTVYLSPPHPISLVLDTIIRHIMKV